MHCHDLRVLQYSTKLIVFWCFADWSWQIWRKWREISRRDTNKIPVSVSPGNLTSFFPNLHDHFLVNPFIMSFHSHCTSSLYKQWIDQMNNRIAFRYFGAVSNPSIYLLNYSLTYLTTYLLTHSLTYLLIYLHTSLLT